MHEQTFCYSEGGITCSSDMLPPDIDPRFKLPLESKIPKIQLATLDSAVALYLIAIGFCRVGTDRPAGKYLMYLVVKVRIQKQVC